MRNLRAPSFKGIANPIKGVEQHAAAGGGKANPIGKFQIGKKTQSSKVKQIFG